MEQHKNTNSDNQWTVDSRGEMQGSSLDNFKCVTERFSCEVRQ